ncbi:hypothetical protein KP509_11G019900 [Ceratopteris richardii]|uniref:Reverse transcriptase domain-containing protein n=1 Tax=Ceratopteris richardii TaxID=49495 RepID=A0A8T2TQH3_CERRI|nr:hypothetical protein KP509_11G019900 [Ceratopteris richardii]
MALQSLKNGKAPGLDGITKEFVMAFWPLLKNLILDVCNEIWRDQKMPYSFKMGKIKLIPKMEVPTRIGDWRPITMMSIIYKIFARVFALRLKCIVHKIVHPSQMGFADDTFIFAKAERENIKKILDSLAPFSQASALKIKMRKSAIINISAQKFQAIEWEGPKIERGVIFRHLGYPLGVGVPIKDKVDWILHRVKSWEYVCQPKDKGGLGILNLHAHLMARRTAFIMRIVSSHTP